MRRSRIRIRLPASSYEDRCRLRDIEAAKAECAYCRAHAGDNMMPPHTPSIHCESGKHPHCTCDVCY
jgi:hypothetical protein